MERAAAAAASSSSPAAPGRTSEASAAADPLPLARQPAGAAAYLLRRRAAEPRRAPARRSPCRAPAGGSSLPFPLPLRRPSRPRWASPQRREPLGSAGAAGRLPRLGPSSALAGRASDRRHLPLGGDGRKRRAEPGQAREAESAACPSAQSRLCQAGAAAEGKGEPQTTRARALHPRPLLGCQAGGPSREGKAISPPNGPSPLGLYVATRPSLRRFQAGWAESPSPGWVAHRSRAAWTGWVAFPEDPKWVFPEPLRLPAPKHDSVRSRNYSPFFF